MEELLSKLVILCLFCFVSVYIRAEPAICNEHGVEKYGDPSHFKLGENLSFDLAIKAHLQESIDEISRVMNLSPEYRGPDKEYIPRLIELMAGPTVEKRFACLWSHYEKGDVLRRFTEINGSSRRQGLAVTRKGKVVAYLYTSIVEV